MKGAWGPSEERLQVSAHPSQADAGPLPRGGWFTLLQVQLGLGLVSSGALMLLSSLDGSAGPPTAGPHLGSQMRC